MYQKTSKNTKRQWVGTHYSLYENLSDAIIRTTVLKESNQKIHLYTHSCM